MSFPNKDDLPGRAVSVPQLGQRAAAPRHRLQDARLEPPPKDAHELCCSPCTQKLNEGTQVWESDLRVTWGN